VYLTDMSAADRVLELIDQYNLYGRRGREVRFLPGAYSFRELAAWSSCFQARGHPEISQFGIRERVNRVYVGVATASGVRQVEAAIIELGLPLGAFLVERRDYIRINSTAPASEPRVADTVSEPSARH
jgi:hypothetical protein